jgi:hypothetical protein
VYQYIASVWQDTVFTIDASGPDHHWGDWPMTLIPGAGAVRAVVRVIFPPPAPPPEPPSADAGPDQLVLVWETVYLDGSLSFDPDGVLVDFSWDFGDGAFGTGESVTHQYGTPGNYTVSLVVTDDEGLVDIDTAQVEVLSSQESIDLLWDMVGELDLPSGTINSLQAQLEAARDAIDRGNGNAAAAELNAFVLYVSALMQSKRLDPATGYDLLEWAERIIASLE